jgi:hypothetical protein
MKKFALALTAAATLFVPTLSQAESDIVSGAGNASAKLDFRVTIPRVLYLRVGAGSLADDATVNLIDFTVPAGAVGNGAPVAATVASGDLGNGAVTVRLFGNNGDISLNSATTGPMTNGVATETLPWSQITVTPNALAATTPGYTNSALSHPAFNNGAAGGAGTATVLTAANKVIRQEARWTYAYANANVLAAGTYGGVNANAGRVTYTATMP